MSSRANQWFVPGDGIAREVITADIQRYLGPDALVRPGSGSGEYEGRSGYWITAYRTLTSQMIQDLKLDSQRWQQEQGRQESGRGVAYQDSRTHAARQHWGPSEVIERREPEPVRPTHSSRDPRDSRDPRNPPSAYDSHYTTAAAASGYGGAHPSVHPPTGYSVQQQPGYAAEPRTNPSYAGYAPSGREYAPTQASAYSSYATQEPYRQQPPPPTHGYTAPSPVAAPGYYIASDGRQYPLAQQPQQAQPGRRRGA